MPGLTDILAPNVWQCWMSCGSTSMRSPFQSLHDGKRFFPKKTAMIPAHYMKLI